MSGTTRRPSPAKLWEQHRAEHLRPREMDAVLCRFLGFRRRRGNTWSRGKKGTPGYRAHWPGPFRYSTNRNDCAEVEARVLEMGLGQRYAWHLAELIDGFNYESPLEAWPLFITASPKNRCRALIRTLKEAGAL